MRTEYLLEIPIAVILWLLFWLGPFCGLLWLGYYFLSRRMLRLGRARFFLDMVESGLKEGHKPEDTIIGIARTRDNGMGVHFHLLAAYLEKGLSLRDALEQVPRLLPPQVSAMLRAGLQIGDLKQVFPACARLTRDSISQTRGAVNYLAALAFVGFPANIVIVTVLQIYVLPQLLGVSEGMDIPPPTGLLFLVMHRGVFLLAQVLLFITVWCAALIYIDGPRLFSWFEVLFEPLTHWVRYKLPWRRKRMQRDFSGMLAILLDAAMPEPEALAVAADCTANRIFQRRASEAIAELRQGMKLTEAVQKVDDSGEFRWRLTQAMMTHRGFFAAIAGWNESLDAKAFQEEQGTAQLATTALVLLNGLLVGFVVVSVFTVLISILNAGILW